MNPPHGQGGVRGGSCHRFLYPETLPELGWGATLCCVKHIEIILREW